jgi:type II secretory pathway pseudopilin PulG
MPHSKDTSIPLPEILFAVLILGLVSAAVIPTMVYSADARTAECQANVALLNTKLKLYAEKHNGWAPVDRAGFETMLASDKELLTGSHGKCPYGEPYRYDPATAVIVTHKH